MSYVDVFKKKSFFKKVIYIFSLFFVLIPSCDARREHNMNLFYLGLIVLCLGSLMSISKSYKFGYSIIIRLQKKYIISLTIWGGLVVSLLPAYFLKIVNISVIYRYIFLYIFYFCILSKGNFTFEELAWSSFLSNIYICYRCIFELGVVYSYYQGTTVNPNQFAMTLLGGIIGTFYLIIKSTKVKERIFFLVFEFLFLAFLFFSSSRTHMIAVMLIIYIFMIHYLHQEKNFYFFRNSKLKKKDIINLFIIFCFSLFAILKFKNYIITFFFDKWGNHGSNILSHREEIWGAILKGMKIYYGAKLNYNTNGEFFNWINEYGLITFMFFALFIIFYIIQAIKKYKESPDIDNLFFIIVISSYILIALFENIFSLFGKPINVMFLISLGFVLNRKKEKIAIIKQ